MFVRSFIVICCVFVVSSCVVMRHSQRNDFVFTGKVSLCSSDEDLKVHATIDSLSVVKLKFYSDAGFKLAEIILSSDSSYVSYCISDQMKKSINFQLKKYDGQLCLNRLVCDFFQNKILTEPQTCYNISALPEFDDLQSYSILSLSNLPLLTVEQSLKKKNGILPHYRIFNESFCIQFFINKR